MSQFFHLGLVGWPLAHSYSPRLHQAALQACGLEGEYRLYPVSPLPAGQAALAQLLNRLAQGELEGLNVTIPHKQSVLPLVDVLTSTAQATGAVNTLARSGEKLVGDNTDAAGFWADLQNQSTRLCPTGTLSPGNALVLGAGGAARAVVYALAEHGWQVYLTTRRPDQAQRLADDFAHFMPAPISLAQPLTEAAAHLAGLHIDLLVNATPLGMHPHEGVSPWSEALLLPRDCWVYDLVYNPVETRLLHQARQQGVRAANGLGMLVNQAALAFLTWIHLPAEKLPLIQHSMRQAI